MQLNYKSFGAGPGLIVLHGLFGSLDNWQSLAKIFAEHFSVFIVDQRNHGRSPHSDEPFTYSAMADDLSEFMDAHGMVRAHILGHSMGGKTAMQFALSWPERIDKLIVADMAPRRNSNAHDSILDALSRFPFDAVTTREEADTFLRSAAPDFATRQFLLKNLVRTPEGRFEWKFNARIIQRDYDHILAAVESDTSADMPTLFVRGGLSNYIKDSDWQAIQHLFPHSELATIEGAGHWVHADAPVKFAEVVLEFLLR